MGCKLLKLGYRNQSDNAVCGIVVKVLCYKSEGRWFDSSWCLWNSSLT